MHAVVAAAAATRLLKIEYLGLVVTCLDHEPVCVPLHGIWMDVRRVVSSRVKREKPREGFYFPLFEQQKWWH